MSRFLRHLGPVLALIALLAVAFGLQPAAASTGSPTNPKHFFWAKGQASPTVSPASIENDLIYHGGNAGSGAIGVESPPAVYVVYWGPDWVNGFTTTDAGGKVYTSQQLQTYVNDFFGNVGGTAWAGVQTQYCRNIPAGATSCQGLAGAQYVTNPTGQLKGVWTDPSPVPSDIITLGLAENLVNDPIASEAASAVAHFGWDSQATYLILTPPTTIATGQPVYCGYHTQTTSVNGLGNPERFQYSFIPFLNLSWPALGAGGCGMNFVNATSDSFGHGVFDGYSIVTGHEYSEAVTDPDNILSNQDGWNDAQGSENGDKCAWYHTQNVNMGSFSFAVQPTWSNEAFDAGKDGCQVTR
jgi:serine protease